MAKNTVKDEINKTETATAAPVETSTKPTTEEAATEAESKDLSDRKMAQTALQEISELKNMITQLMAGKKATPSEGEDTESAKAMSDDAMKEEIEYIFPYISEKDSTLYIGVNGRFFTIRRGVPVKVPRYVVQTYLDSEQQRTSLYRMQDGFTSNKTLDNGML